MVTYINFLLKISIILCWGLISTEVNGQSKYEGSFLFVNNYPNNGTPSWADDDNLTNGITHDSLNWYFTALSSNAVGQPGGSWVITRIPVSEPLDQDFSGNPAILTRHLEEIDSLSLRRYQHAGDLDNYYRKDDGRDYLFVPLRNDPLYDFNGMPIPGTSFPPSIAVFESDNLQFINFAYLSGPPGVGQKDIGWCAVNPENGYLYTSNDDTEEIFCYKIDWTALLTQPSNHFTITFDTKYPLIDIIGHQPFLIHSMQGGEFSPSGELFFVSCGIIEGPIGIGGAQYDTDGLHVFETNTWKEIQRSFNQGLTCCPPYFRFEFDNSGDGGDEPEGLTYWDLSDGKSPNVSGQLHVILYTHDYFSSNQVKLKHYAEEIYVDNSGPPTPMHGEAVPFPQPGTAARPFNNIHDVFNYYGAWNGSKIVFRPGEYPTNGGIKISVRTQITSEGGTAIIK